MWGMKKVLLTLSLLLLIMAALALGFYFGRQKGTTTATQAVQQKLQPLVELAFPKPPDDIRSLSGVVKGIYGATINLEINDPDDYLPRLDGSPRKKQIRFASVTAATTIVFIDTTQLDVQGNPKITVLPLSDLKIGDNVTVRSDQNIRDERKFDITKVELVKY